MNNNHQPKTRNMKRYKRQQGLALLDILIAFGMLAAAIAGVVALFSDAGAEKKVAVQVQNDVRVINNMIDYFRNDYTGITVEVIIGAGLIPDEMVNAAGDGFLNEWNAPITFTANSLNSGTGNDSFFYITEDVPGDSCAKYVESIEQLFTTINVASSGGSGGTEVKARNGELNRISLATACTNETEITGLVY